MALALAAAPAGAQSWISVGPPGGDVRALAADPREPQRVYLGTTDGILYRSDDGGRSWRRPGPGFPHRGYSLDEIVVTGRGTVYVGFWEVHGRGGGVARSDDGGTTFTLLRGVAGQSVRALAVAPSNPQVIAAGTRSGVFLSRDGGQRWRRISSRRDPNLRNVGSLAFDTRDPDVLYAGTWHLAYKTTNGGGTWTPVHRGMIEDSDVMTLTVDGENRHTVYATACTGIYRSADGGNRWTKLEGIPESSRRTRAFALGRDGSGILAAGTTEGLWVSEDGGAAWKLTTDRKLVVNAVLAQSGGAILAGTEGAGVLRSTDRGRTWTASNTGFSERFISELLFDAPRKRVLAAVSNDARHGGVFAAPGVRGPWTRLGAGLEGRRVLSLALEGGTILAGTDDGIYVRGPKARKWTRLNTRVGRQELHPRVTELFAGPRGRVLAATSKGVLRSLNGGRTWSRPPGMGEAITGLAISPRHLDWVVASTRSGIFRSKDGGVIWRPVSKPLPDVSVHALAFQPSDDRVLFATTTGGLYQSRDRGNTWKLAGGGMPRSDLTGISFHPDGRTIFVGDFARGGIYRSADRGATWGRVPTEGLATDRVWTMGVDPTAPDRLLVAPPAGGLYCWCETRSGGAVSARSAQSRP